MSINNSYTTDDIVNKLNGGLPADSEGYNYLTYSVTDTSKFIAYDPYQTRTDKLFKLEGTCSGQYHVIYVGVQHPSKAIWLYG